MSGVHVGIPPKEWESWESRLVHFHHFEDMSSVKGHGVSSPKFSCCGHNWKVKLYPGGEKGARDGSVSLRLQHCLGPEISAKYAILIRKDNARVFVEKISSKICTFTAVKPKKGWPNFIQREEIIDASNKVLIRGTLTIEVRIKPDGDHCCLNFIPKNFFAQNMLRSFTDETTSDVVFEVRSPADGDGAIFHAHKVVLQFCAKGSMLASLCEDCEKSTPVPISNVDPKVFRKMLYYVYGGNISAAVWKDQSKDFIDAGDRYGVTNFKIEAEAWYVKHLKITLDNVIHTMLYADEKNCFLLKEAAAHFILENGKEVLSSSSFDDIPESKSVIREIISLATMNKKGKTNNDLGDLTELSINELRARLYMEGKDVDGPRQRLIARLDSKEQSEASGAE